MNEMHFGNRVRQALNQGLRLNEKQSKRLHAARERARAAQRPEITGPLAWADNVVGLKKIHDALLKYRDASGDPFWEPAPLLKKLVQEDKKFSSV